MLSVLIGVLIICVAGAICFWAIEKFVNDSRLAQIACGADLRERDRSGCCRWRELIGFSHGSISIEKR